MGFQLTEKELEILKEKAKEQRRSKASVATEALLKYLSKNE